MAKERIDRDDEDLVRLYLTDIGQYLLLTKDDEVRLAKAIEEGKAAEATLNKTEKQVDPTKRRELNKVVKAGAKQGGRHLKPVSNLHRYFMRQ